MTYEKNLNIACGNSYVVSNEWVNLDFEPVTEDVLQCDILKDLPFKENSISNVYCSHFVEHVPDNELNELFKNFYKILKPGGRLLIVTPDFNEMCKSYIKAVDENDKDTSSFIKLEILDQLVRIKEGGQLRKKFKSYFKTNNQKMIELVKFRTGYDVKKYEVNQTKNNIKPLNEKLYIKLRTKYIKLVLNFLPKNFRSQNVTYLKTGENHKWIWDFDDLKQSLSEFGFCNISKETLNSSGIKNFPFELDIHDGKPKKGMQSMYVEAQKK